MTIAYLELGLIVAAIVLGGLFHQRVRRWRQGVLIACALAVVVLGAHAVHQLVKRDEAVEPTWGDRARVWPKVPLRLKWDKQAFKDYDSAIRAGMALYNSQGGCWLVTEATGPEHDVEILFFKGSTCGVEFGGHAFQTDKLAQAGTFFCPDGTAQVQVKWLDALDQSYPVLGHELGHVLGLAHDPGGLMRPVGVEKLEYPQIRISPPDREALAGRYCRGAVP